MKIAKQEIDGIINAPASKSIMQRAVAAALLTEGTTRIANPSFSDDAITAIDIVKALGAELSKKNAKINGKEFIEIHGKGIKGNVLSHTLNCNESGFCMRLFSAIVALFEEEFVLTGKNSLLTRPMNFIESPLRSLGAKCGTNKGFPPIRIQGPINGRTVEIDGSISSQFLSGLLMALPLCMEDSEIKVRDLKSKSYVRMTLNVLSDFGINVNEENFETFRIEGNQRYTACNYSVEGDWSSAAFLLVAGAIVGKIRVTGLGADSLQADRAIIEALEKAGANVKVDKRSVSVEKNELNGFEFSVEECPDLFPVTMVLASNCKGKSVIKGIERLQHKESSRAKVMSEELKKIGGKIKLFKDHVEVVGGNLHGGVIDSHNDHRIAMACAIAGMNSEKGVEVKSFECVSKSFPAFFEELKKIGVVLNE